MILVDIQCPLLERIYDFELDEEGTVDCLVEEIAELIGEQEHLSCRSKEKMCLYGLRQEQILDREMTLKQQGVQEGDRLILL